MDPTLDALCPGCFAHKGQANPCPHCGYDERAERSPLLLPHRTLLNGQFLVGRVLGKPGGFGITYLGWDLNLETRVAIKEYLPRDLAGRAGDRTSVAPHSLEDGDLFRYGLEQFLREARTLAQLDHPNIVRVRQFFEANGTAYLVMDYYQGLSLGEHLERQGGRLAEDQAKQLMLPVLDGLRAVHVKGFLHRDIKPENIYLAHTDSGGVRPILLDFGAARQAMGERSRSLSVLVSAGYAPFEQYQRRGNQGPWTDIYSAAAVLYRLVTGEPPPEAIERVSGDEIKPAASFGVSKRMSDALGTALALAPEARPQTVPEFQARLWGDRPPQELDPAATLPIRPSAPTSEHRSAQSVPPTSPEAGKGSASPAGSGSTPRRWLWPAVLAVIVVLLGLGGWYQYHQDQIEAKLRKAADDRAFETALGTNTDAAYRAYLSACSADGCGHRPKAEQRLRELAAEAQAEAERVARERAAQERAQQEAEHQAADRQAAVEAKARAEQAEAAARAKANPALNPPMVRAPPGSFLMGCQKSEKGCLDVEKPAHRVEVKAFELGKYEVTFAEWDACVADGGCRHKPSDEHWGRATRPVINVSWDDTQQYLSWLRDKTGQAWRLPTEAEWEYAARAGTTTRFSTGDCITTDQANLYGSDYNGCRTNKTGVGIEKTQPVGSYPANPWGLSDMHGNILEWVEDCWNDSYVGAPTDGSSWRHGDCWVRVQRGGCWNSLPLEADAVSRTNDASKRRLKFYGFRLARTITP